MFIQSICIQQERKIYIEKGKTRAVKIFLLLSLLTVMSWPLCLFSSQIDGLVKIPFCLFNLCGLFPVIWPKQVSLLTNMYRRSLTSVDIIHWKAFDKLPVPMTMLWSLKNVSLYTVFFECFLLCTLKFLPF